jgi:hypothetical protein
LSNRKSSIYEISATNEWKFYYLILQLTSFEIYLDTIHKPTNIDLVWQLSRCFVFNLDLLQTRMLILIYGLLFSGSLHVFHLGPKNRMTGRLMNTQLEGTGEKMFKS